MNFTAYQATMTSKTFGVYPVRVINSRDNVTFKDGSVGRALKVQEQTYRNIGNAYNQSRTLVSVGAPFWTKAALVSAHDTANV